MVNKNFSPWPCFTTEETDAVSKVLLSNKVNYWTGQEGRQFEQEFAQFADSDHAIAVANGTVALDLALVALDVGQGNNGDKSDEVIVTSRTFIASVSSVVTCGAMPVFVDVDLNSQNITAKTIAEAITERTKAIICVHLAGMPCEMDEIMTLARQHNLAVIEDCAQAHGAKYKGKSVGSIGDIGAWSFCQDKIMTTGGEGGMVTTNNKNLWKKMWSFKDHGKSWDAIYNKEHPPGFRWLHESFGTNWRLTEMQSAIGRIQLKRMPLWYEKRNAHANALEKALSRFKCIRLMDIPHYIQHAQYKYYAFLKSDLIKEGWNRDKIVAEINQLGVPCFQGSCSEVYLEKAFEPTTYRPIKPLDNAIQLGEISLMFLVHPSLTENEINRTQLAINNVLNLACL